MKKSPVGAGTFCPLSILIFYILLCWKYLPVSEAGPSPRCYRKIPEDPQIKNVRKNCRRFTAWGGKVQDLDIFGQGQQRRLPAPPGQITNYFSASLGNPLLHIYLFLCCLLVAGRRGRLIPQTVYCRIHRRGRSPEGPSRSAKSGTIEVVYFILYRLSFILY